MMAYFFFDSHSFFRQCQLNQTNQNEVHIVSIEFTPQEILPPEFVLTKPDVQWNEEEKKIYKEYEKKSKELITEKEKYKKVLQSQCIHTLDL